MHVKVSIHLEWTQTKCYCEDKVCQGGAWPNYLDMILFNLPTNVPKRQ